MRVHLGKEWPDCRLRQKLKAPLKDAAAVRVSSELKDSTSEGGNKVEAGLGQGDDPLDDVIGIGRFDAVRDVVLEFCDEDVALLARDDLEGLAKEVARGGSVAARLTAGAPGDAPSGSTGNRTLTS